MPSRMTALIDLQHVSKTFAGGGRSRSSDFSLTIEADQPRFIAVVGESGSGKTTLARLLLGMIAPTEGEVRYQGDDLSRLSGSQKHAFRRDVQAVFQDPYEVYNPFYRVDHVLTTPVRKFKLAASKVQGRALIENALRSVGSAGRKRSSAGTRTSCPAASGSASWWRAPCCCSRA